MAHVPVIFNGDWRYHEEASRYLRERSAPTQDDIKMRIFRSRRSPTRLSLKAFAERLVNFLDWCEARDRRNRKDGKQPYWKVIDYDAVVRYGVEMEAGTFSTRGALKTATVELRKDTASEFLEWSSARGLRDPIDVPKKQIRYRSGTATGVHAIERESESRVDKKRVSKDSLRIPTDQEVERWLRALRIKFGPTKHLMAELILNTGIRISEATSWRIDTLPHEKASWRISHVEGKYVTVKLTHGTKGPKRDGPAGELGPPRHIALPVGLAEKLWHYQEYVRPRLLRLYVKSAGTKDEQARRRANPPRQLFLSDYLGVPVTAHRLREAWKGAAPLPFPEWHPHFGRDFWACKTLLLELDRQMKAAKIQADHGIVINWIQGSADTVITTKIQPQLGHVDPKTTRAYIAWVVGAFDLTVLHDAYARRIGDVCELSEKEGDPT